ncbi:MAG: hypothetical protein KTR15_08590 [Phycisphaeraceae bacterium]|nr:hypothetical protein [Phycisphaeraceae bacterium]
MSIEKPSPLHPDTVAEMKHSGWRGWAKGQSDLDQHAEAINRELRLQPPQRIVDMYAIAKKGYEDPNRDLFTMLGYVKLSELVAEWYSEVAAGLHDEIDDADAGG